MCVPDLRVRSLNDAPVDPEGDYVVYWMIGVRRLSWSFAVDRALERAKELGKPLLVFEPLRCGYRWASDRLHRFVLDGMRDHAAELDGSPVGYFPYVEGEEGAGKGLLAAIAERAAVIVTDDYPCFFLPRMTAAAADKLAVRLEAVDGNGLLPMRAADKTYARAYDLRRFLQKALPDHLGDLPAGGSLADRAQKADLPAMELPGEIRERWPAASEKLLEGSAAELAELPIDHDVAPAGLTGGPRAAAAALERFLDERLSEYSEERNQPDAEVTSGFSPYLHWGHLSPHQVFAELTEHEGWTPDRLADDAKGSREGWWGMSEDAEAFLDQIVTWRELGFNMTSRNDDYDHYESLPDWARATLEEHAGDERPYLYSADEFERAETDSEIWNAAQRQIRRTGIMHNYLRMVWGKKVLHWTESPQTAIDILIELNNKYGLDGRDPNSYSGIFWCFGRYDRAWGPEREVFGKVRFMSLASTQRKLRLKDYLERFGPESEEE